MATITEEIRTFFLGDTAGLERATGRATASLDQHIRRERDLYHFSEMIHHKDHPVAERMRLDFMRG